MIGALANPFAGGPLLSCAPLAALCAGRRALRAGALLANARATLCACSGALRGASSDALLSSLGTFGAFSGGHQMRLCYS